MTSLELSAAAVLAATGLFSAGLVALSPPAENTVKLADIVRDATTQDPFDVTRAEDIIDGEPVDAAKFWSQVCRYTISQVHVF